VRSAVLGDGVYGCPVKIHTAAGDVTTADEVAVCPDTWRRWVPALPSLSWARAEASHAVLGDDIIIVGGARSDDGDVVADVIRMPMPRCGASSPEPEVVTGTAAVLPDQLGVYRPNFTEYNDQLYVFGGVTAGIACTMVAARLDWDSDAGTGAWTPLATLVDPDGLGCRRDGVAFPVRDLTTGEDFIIIYGGIDGSNGFEDFEGEVDLFPGNDYFLIYDLDANTYTAVLHPVVNGNSVSRFMRGTSDGTTGVFMADNTRFYSFVLNNGVATVTELPGFGFTDWPTFAHAGGRFYAFEGKSQRVFSLALGQPAWQLHRPMLDQHWYGAAVVSNFDEPPGFVDRTRFVMLGGYQQVDDMADPPLTLDPFQIEEYNPL
jgi:hypothetical protein